MVFQKENPIGVLKELEIDFDMAWRFVDGACQGVLVFCRVGVNLFLDEQHSLKLRLVSRPSTNYQTKCYAMWFLLKPTIDKGVKSLKYLVTQN